MKETINIFWFRRDLRVKDNCGLFQALSSNRKVLPVFIFDVAILNKLQNKNDKRVEFIFKEVEQLKKFFEKSGSSLFVFHGTPEDVFTDLCRQYNIEKVFTNSDYEPYGIQRDLTIKKLLTEKNILFLSFKDIVIFEGNEVVKPDGKPYNVFTPYSKKWKEKLLNTPIKSYDSEKLLNNLLKITPLRSLSIFDIGFKNNNTIFPDRKTNIELIKQYEQNRDIPSINGTSKLSLHLRFGTISIRKLVAIALATSEKWLNELIWREFYQMILFHYPHVVNSAFKKEYDNIVWDNNEEYFYLWCNGKTGFPIVDAGIRELNETGFMHNRVRMIVSSFLTKDLLIDWRWGEAYFAEHLLDFELASNNGGWQWAAGCGVDAAPYFRIFNPTLQANKFDVNNEYIKKWIPEFRLGDYPKPMIDHKTATQKTIEKYKQALIKK